MTTITIWLMLACPYIDSRPGCFNIMFATQQACEKAGKAVEFQSNNVGMRRYFTTCVQMEVYNK